MPIWSPFSVGQCVIAMGGILHQKDFQKLQIFFGFLFFYLSFSCMTHGGILRKIAWEAICLSSHAFVHAFVHASMSSFCFHLPVD